MSINSIRYQPIHALSKLAVAKEWNVFVWEKDMSLLRIGFSLHERSHITVSTFYRWVKMLNYTHDIGNFALVPVEVLPVHCELFRYETRPKGPSLCPNSAELLLPGDYSMGPIGNGKASSISPGGEEKGRTFQELQIKSPALYQQNADRCSLLDEQVRHRDGRCLLTGISASECALTSVWLMPPSRRNKRQTIQQVWEIDIAFSKRRSGASFRAVLENVTGEDIDISLCPVARVASTVGHLPVRDEMAEYFSDPDPRDWSQTARNYITIREGLAEMFMQNKFTVDPEDDYRIVVPDLSDEIRKIPLLTHMTLDHITDPSLRPKDRFFRGHFFRTLLCNSLGGDVSGDYNFELDDCMEEFGAWDGTFDPTNPVWQTQLGKEMWTKMLMQRISE